MHVVKLVIVYNSLHLSYFVADKAEDHEQDDKDKENNSSHCSSCYNQVDRQTALGIIQ